MNYATYHPVGMIIGQPYYDVGMGYYYNGYQTFRAHQGQPMNPVVAIIIIVIVCGIICIAALNSKNHGVDYDDEFTETVTETIYDDGAPAGPVYWPPG